MVGILIATFFGMIHTTALCNRACLEIKWKMASFFLVGVKTTIHLFTYSLSGNKIKKWTTFSCSELKHLFTYSPIHLLVRRFRRIEPKGCRSVYGRQNWAYVTKRRHCCMNHTVALCTRDFLEIKWKTINVFLLRVKTPIHLFTYSPIHLFTFCPLVWT